MAKDYQGTVPDEPQQGILDDEAFQGVLVDMRTVDVLLVIDTSESMKDDIAAIRDNVTLIADEISKRDIDWRIGVLACSRGGTIGRSPWKFLDLTDDIEAVRRKLGEVEAGRWDECTPHALDWALEHVSWRHDAKPFFAIFTDEPVEDGMDCTQEQFDLLCEKIRRKGAAICLAGTQWCFEDRGRTLMYAQLRNFRRVYTTTKLREERGEKLLKWLVASVSNPGGAGASQPTSASLPRDIFGMFDSIRVE